MTIALICPADRTQLVETLQTDLLCHRCGRRYPVEDGVVRLLGRTSDFYEGAFDNHVRFVPRSERPWHVWPLWLINSGYPWAVRRFVSPGSTVVELGCGGGLRYFGLRYRMVGCDLSLSSLKKLEMYERSVQADAANCIPLLDNSVDAVVSSYFWEHIPPLEKPKILKECRRVLRPGGKLIFLYDVETDNSLIRSFKCNNQSRYEQLFIESDGHLGYQRPVENLTIFEKGGFKITSHQGMEKTWFQSPSVYTKLAQFEGRWARLLALASWLGRPPLSYAYTAVLRIIDTLICPLLPKEWARVDLVICRSEPT